MFSIDIIQLSFSYPNSRKPLLTKLSMHIGAGERAVIVGPNGAGKTTLLRLLRGELRPDSGSINIAGKSSVPAHPQTDALAATASVQDYLNVVLADINDDLQRFEVVASEFAVNPDDAALTHEYDELLASLTATDAWGIESRSAAVLAGLGLEQCNDEGRDRTLASLSPGQLGRLELAALLLRAPEVLLLDEPTNHLDDAGREFLIGQLQSFSGPVLIATHDRDFIEQTATVIYDLDTPVWQALATAPGAGQLPGVYRCSGGYSDYLQAKTQAYEEHERLHAAQQREKRELKQHRRNSEDIARGGVRVATAQGVAKKFFADRAAKTAVRRTRSADLSLEHLSQREVRKPREFKVDLHLQAPNPTGALAVSARDAGVPDRLAPQTFDLSSGEHLLLTGSNGAGKSTLLHWIATGAPRGSQPEQLHGELSVHAVLAYIPQRLPNENDAGFTAEIWANGIGELGAGIVHPSLWHTPIADLSAGNQRRVQFALASAQAPELLVIDEPTNYLDLATIEALEAALQAWPGTVILSSHDRWLIDHWQGQHRHL
ncbi:MAG: ATP-binding cassette domain-containing protein [Corynebacterium sp.]|nr:ATP-binding cassette domain-containing protein [Corynebacterium sp.]